VIAFVGVRPVQERAGRTLGAMKRYQGEVTTADTAITLDQT
jgi:hypothetical protein